MSVLFENMLMLGNDYEKCEKIGVPQAWRKDLKNIQIRSDFFKSLFI